MRLAFAASAATLALVTTASATGTLVCEAEDKAVAFSVQSVLGGLRRGTVMNLTGTLELKVRGAPADLRKLDLVQEDVTQAWLDGKLFKLELYRERGETPGAYVTFEIDSRRISEGRYRGSYIVTMDTAGKDGAYGSTPRIVRGAVTCSTD